MDIKEKLLALAIAIIFVFFIAYGFNTFYPEPRFQDRCGELPYEVVIDDCPSWDAQQKGAPIPRAVGEQGCWCSQDCSSGDCVKGACFEQNPAYLSCQETLEEDREYHNRIVFIGSLIIGLLFLVLGGVVISTVSVSTGLMGGSILTIIYGTIRYWGNLEDVGRFLILGAVLAVLIWIGFKKLSPKKKK